MKKILVIGLISASLALPALAAEPPTPGQKLSEAQIAQWGKLPSYQVGKSHYQVLPVRPAGGQYTLLLNSQGIVGISHNEIAISQVSRQAAETGLAKTTPQPLSIEYFEQARVTNARYANFEQAVTALKVLQAALPEAQVRLPLQFGQTRPNRP